MADVILRADGLEAGLRPEAGGAFSHFTDLSGKAPVELLRRARDDFDDALDSAGYPLVPFSNRVRDGRFTFRGKAVELAPNLPGHRHPLHGQGWRTAWTVERADANVAELAFRQAAGAWPWDYEARLLVVLQGRGMDVILSARNLSPDVMPCGLGLHPFYPCDAQTVFDASVRTAWTTDAGGLPLDAVPAAGRFSLQRRRICGQGLDHGYDGWTGEALIQWPAARRALRLTSDVPRLQVYAPAEGGMFAAEPVTNATDAFNRPESEWPALGLWRLEPGQAAKIGARFQILSI